MVNRHHNEPQLLNALHALKSASNDLESNNSDPNSPSLNALLQLQTNSTDLFFGDPKLTPLSSLLSRLKSISCLNTKSTKKEISKLASSIKSELQSWIDRHSINRLLDPSVSDSEKRSLLTDIDSRLSQGFNRDFQDFLLRSSAFSVVESLLENPNSSKQVRDLSASAILAFVKFNKDVFVGAVLTAPTVKYLIDIASPASIKVLNGLISSIRSPIVDELLFSGEIASIIKFVFDASIEIDVRALAFETVLDIGYYGRKGAIDAMIEQGLVKKLVQLQRSELGGMLIEVDGDCRPFASCVSRFSIQLEVGEGLRQREKREVKLEVLRRVQEAASSAAEAASIVAEVLWGSTAW